MNLPTVDRRPTHRNGRRGRLLIEIGGWLSALNGLAHFALPLYFPWEGHVRDLYEPVRWALYATTVFFGVVLLLAGLLVVAVARSRELPPRFAHGIVLGMAGFWVVGAVYEIVVPFPDPYAAWALPVFSLVVALLLVAGVLRRRHADPSAAGASVHPGPDG